MKAVWVAVIILVLSCTAFTQWRSWGTYKGHRTYYQQLTRQRGLVRVWIKKDRILAQLAFDCGQHKVRYLSAIGNEELLEATDKWNTPSSLYSKWLYNKACP